MTWKSWGKSVVCAGKSAFKLEKLPSLKVSMSQHCTDVYLVTVVGSTDLSLTIQTSVNFLKVVEPVIISHNHNVSLSDLASLIIIWCRRIFLNWFMWKVGKPVEGQKIIILARVLIKDGKTGSDQGHLAQTFPTSYFPLFLRYACHNLTTSFQFVFKI